METFWWEATEYSKIPDKGCSSIRIKRRVL